MMWMTFAMLSIMIALVLPTLSTMIFFKSTQEKEKNSPFECGFEPMKSARKGFSLKFFLLSVLFLIFDIEIALLIPMPMCTSSHIPLNKMMMFITFIIILIMGLIYEWKKGMLSWSK